MYRDFYGLDSLDPVFNGIFEHIKTKIEDFKEFA